MTRAYMLSDGSPEDGAVLVLASNAREARRLGWRTVADWTTCLFHEVRVRWLKEADVAALEARYGAAPKVVDCPDTCTRCELWHERPLVDGLCENCRDWLESEAP